MNMTRVGIVIAVLVILAGAVWYTRTPDVVEQVVEDDFGTYAYTCDKGVAFSLTPSADLMTISISPVAGMAYPHVSTLVDSPTDTGRRFRSTDFELHGQGETVTLYDVKTTTTYTCVPQPKPDEAPFNFGD